MSHIINLDKQKFSTLMGIVSTLSRYCADMPIKNGKVSQFNDVRNVIFQIDLTSILENSSILMSGIASKVELLDPFKKQNIDVDLIINNDINPGNYIFQDSYTKLQFTFPLEKFITNPYLSDEFLADKLTIDSESIFNFTIKDFLIERLSSISKGLSAKILRFDFEGDRAVIKVTASDQNITTVAKLVTIENLNKEVTGSCAFPIQPFLLGNFDMDMECYYRTSNGTIVEDELILKTLCNIGEIPIIMWCVAKIHGDEEE